jgi:hypothetical protein
MSNDVQIPDSTIMEWLGGAVIGALGWAFKLQRGHAKLEQRLDSMGDILNTIDKKLDKHDAKMDAQDQHSMEFRESFTQKLDDVNRIVAVLQAYSDDSRRNP